MSSFSNVLWVSTCQSLKRFDLPLLYYFAQYVDVNVWEFQQNLDEASYLQAPVELLYDYLKFHDTPVHLIGHGINGVVGLMLAREYPQYVRSLTLIAVDFEPGNTWHAYYYRRRQLFDASFEEVLFYTVLSLFGSQLPYTLHQLANFLYTALEETPSTHSILNIMQLPPGGADVPLMICGSRNDVVVPEPKLREWLTCYKQGDSFLEYSSGNHFFHYFYAQEIGREILNFWENHHPEMFKK
ncbi:MAG: alpha/beta hydrolase [Calothrix sp. C42_A2020_038]|nr:alpha/beta hydrolase [Calothrix sp. C42_A2020_038]